LLRSTDLPSRDENLHFGDDFLRKRRDKTVDIFEQVEEADITDGHDVKRERRAKLPVRL